ncbi:LCP family protein [Nonomuraea typhae]|uniref:LCP family protein n=1 Tax=Nonomuraea typhae TaxID=2603600 RepID=A0ABW7Z1T9_9ACTN
MTTILAVAILGGYAYYRILEGDLIRKPVNLGTQRPPETGALNLLMIGSDSRDGDNQKYGATSHGLGERSDTLMLLHVSPDRDKVTLVSFPRDLMVTVPQCEGRNGGVIPAGVRQINSAFNDGGEACVMRTVESLTKLRLNHFVKVDFTGFKGVVDALGGISICLPKPVNDPKAKLVLAAGKHVVKGEQALGYVRARSSMGDGSDLSRIKRQQIFLTQVMKKVTDGGLLTDPGRLDAFLRAAVAAVTVDDQLSLDRMLEIARSVQGMTASQLKGITVPVQAYKPNPNRVELAQPAADEFFTRLRDDVEVTKSSAPPPAAQAPEKITNDKVRVQVLNGSGRPGLAKQVAEELAAQKFVVTETGNAPTAAVTQIRYAKRQADGAAYGDVVAGRLSRDKRAPVAGKIKPISTERFTARTAATPPPTAAPSPNATSTPAPGGTPASSTPAGDTPAGGTSGPASAGGGPIVQLVIGADWPGVRVLSVIPDSLKEQSVDASTNPCQ